MSHSPTGNGWTGRCRGEKMLGGRPDLLLASPLRLVLTDKGREDENDRSRKIRDGCDTDKFLHLDI